MTTSVHFITPGEIDLRALTMFGLSSKSSDQIGRFGTGLKYATAIVCRLGGSITLQTSENTHTIQTAPGEFRGTSVDYIYLDDQPLNITTNLGRDWEPWMAYREFYTNTLDEGGRVELSEVPELRDGESCISVKCDAIAAIYLDSALYFIDPEEVPLYSSEVLDIYQGSADALYYRGIRVCQLPDNQRAQFRYNLKHGVRLTEDRTSNDLWGMCYDIAKSLQRCDSPQILLKALHRDSTFESTLTYRDIPDISATFLGTTAKLGIDAQASAVICGEKARLNTDSPDALHNTDNEAHPNNSTIISLINTFLTACEFRERAKIRIAISDNSAVGQTHAVRSDGTIIIAQSLADSDPSQAVFCGIDGICQHLGRSWLIAASIKLASRLISQ